MSLLTNADIKAICNRNGWDDSWESMKFARAIEHEARQRAFAELEEIIEARAKRADDSWERTADPMDMGIEHGCNECIGLINEHAAKEAK